MDERARLAAALEQLTAALSALDGRITPLLEFVSAQAAADAERRENERVEARVAEALARLGAPVADALPSPWHQNRKIQGGAVSGIVAAIVVAVAKLLGVGGPE